MTALLVCASIYTGQVKQDIRASGLSAPALKLTILPVTLTAAAVLFVIIISRKSPDLPTRMASAAIGAIAAPMIFELPFDPIVIFRIHWLLPDPPPWTLVYVPLVLVEITTLLLLRLSPMVRLSRATFFSVALMLGVWAAWAWLDSATPRLRCRSPLTSRRRSWHSSPLSPCSYPSRPRQGRHPGLKTTSKPTRRPGTGPLTRRLLVDMAPPPDSGSQINSFCMLPLMDTGRFDTNHVAGYLRPAVPRGDAPVSMTDRTKRGNSTSAARIKRTAHSIP